ncbi:MAG: nucleotidyltransferase domain-containing protein [Thermodesulfobacteriota bacterium]|nr:nucleotidyltransferase domain-containing protein [Thermodesulfobacteriota bacterium]
MNVLAEILSSKIRAEIFRLLFGTSAEELHMREIERRSGYAIGTIQTELKKLLRLDLVKKRKDGNRLYYRANKEHPLYPDIRSLALKTIGLVDILKNALRQDSDISIAFVFGSIALHEETAGSDVDLMVIGKLGLRKLTGMLSGVSEHIGREINPHVLSVNEFVKRKTNREHFITQVLEAPKIFIIGNENEFESMG